MLRMVCVLRILCAQRVSNGRHFSRVVCCLLAICGGGVARLGSTWHLGRREIGAVDGQNKIRKHLDGTIGLRLWMLLLDGPNNIRREFLMRRNSLLLF